MNDTSNTVYNNGTVYTFDSIIGESAALQTTIDKAKRISRSPSNILITGETGTGKELFAQAMHNASSRASEPFVAINCSAIPETLLESFFFGTVKGAFTGATNSPGIFERAGKGTVLLDEINSMPLLLQNKLLRVLQERVIERLGSHTSIPVNCSVFSTTNSDPIECIRNNLLREDLFYRLSVIGVNVPPLRERGSDILLLADFFINKYMRIYERTGICMTDTFKQALLEHSWPGNVRELEHVIEGTIAALEFDCNVIDLKDLPRRFQEEFSGHNASLTQDTLESAHSIRPDDYQNLKEKIDSYERDLLLQALDDNGWNLSHVAKATGYNRSKLQYRIKILNIAKQTSE